MLQPHGYRVFFNRDEQVHRPKALLPKIFEGTSTKSIMPVDPQGGGTWCAVNDYGLTLALLNYYQGRLPKGRLISRGQIVKRCTGYESLTQVKAYLQALNLAKYAPFSLLMFEPRAEQVCMMRWNGKTLEESQQNCPLISSAVRYEEVHNSRLEVYHKLISTDDTIADREDDFMGLHRSHLPSRSASSVCMHRNDAMTVSFSRIDVEDEYVRFFYSDGPPCENPVFEAATLPRH